MENGTNLFYVCEEETEVILRCSQPLVHPWEPVTVHGHVVVAEAEDLEVNVGWPAKTKTKKHQGVQR